MDLRTDRGGSATAPPQGDPDGGKQRRRYAEREASFLAEASRMLADSLDYETTLGTVAMLALPHLGAWCIVDVVEEGGEIRRVAVVHPDAGKQALARELRDGWPPSRTDPFGVPAVARTRRSEVISRVDDDLLRRVGRNEENIRRLQQLGIGSLMIVPLVSRGDVLGAMTFVGGEDARYDRDDLALAEDLAARAASAIDNARLYRVAEQAREAAERANQGKSQFLGIMSHELRTPINAILGYTQLLDMGVRGGLTDEQRILLSRIEASGQHLQDMVTRLLDMSKAESGELIVQSEVNLVGEVVEAAIKAVRSIAGSRRIDFRAEPGAPGRFLGDGIRVRQILISLLTNAIQFTDADGLVTVISDDPLDTTPPVLLRGETGPWVRISVEDNGVGIPAERLDAVFEPFVQGDATPLVRERDGTGLGLALSRYLARLMAGELTVVSDPGVGSRFSLWLLAPRAAPEPRPDRRLFPRDTSGLSILSDHLLHRLKPIMDTYVARLRQDGAVPRAGEASDIALRDHVPHFLSGIASLLSHADSSGPEISAVLQGGNAIQRLTLELHGAERHSLGWSTDALRRDLAILRAVIETDLRDHGPTDGDLEQLLGVLERLFDQAQRISLQGWHYARSDNPEAHSLHPPRDEIAAEME